MNFFGGKYALGDGHQGEQQYVMVCCFCWSAFTTKYILYRLAETVRNDKWRQLLVRKLVVEDAECQTMRVWMSRRRTSLNIDSLRRRHGVTYMYIPSASARGIWPGRLHAVWLCASVPVTHIVPGRAGTRPTAMTAGGQSRRTTYTSADDISTIIRMCRYQHAARWSTASILTMHWMPMHPDAPSSIFS